MLVKSLAVTFISKTQESARAEADALFSQVFGEGAYAVGGVELTPYELSDPYDDFVEKTNPSTGEKVTVVEKKRDVISWQGTFAAHPVA